MQLVEFYHEKIFPMPHVHVLAENIQVVDLVNVRTIVLMCVTTHVPGATSFEKLKTVNDYTATTFHEVCKLNHLLDDDSEWDNVLLESSHFQMPRELCDLYATICSQCEPENPLQLWMNYKAYMIEGYVRTLSIDDAERIPYSGLFSKKIYFQIFCLASSLQK